jgi:hypothetical protein
MGKVGGKIASAIDQLTGQIRMAKAGADGGSGDGTPQGRGCKSDGRRNGEQCATRHVPGIDKYIFSMEREKRREKMDERTVIKETLNLLDVGFDPSQIVALMRLRHRVQREEDEEWAITYRRLKFARWLVEHEMLSE